MKAGSKGIIPVCFFFLGGGGGGWGAGGEVYILEFLCSLFRTRMEVAWKETEGKG